MRRTSHQPNLNLTQRSRLPVCYDVYLVDQAVLLMDVL